MMHPGSSVDHSILPSTFPISLLLKVSSETVQLLGQQINQFTVPEVYFKKSDQEVVIFCGSPGAGKSTFYWKSLKPLGFERVNQDILKTVSYIHVTFRQS